MKHIGSHTAAVGPAFTIGVKGSYILDAGDSLSATDSAADAVGLKISASPVTVTINGSVTSSSQLGIALDGALLGTSSIKIGKHGTVTGAKIGLDLESSASITNAGTLTGNTLEAIYHNGALGTIKNSGLIHSNNYGIFVAAGTHAIVNAGTIEGNTGLYHLGAGKITNSRTIDGGVIGIYASGAAHTLTNTGTIQGCTFSVELTTGNNLLKNGGTLDGAVLFGSGDDNFFDLLKVGHKTKHGFLNGTVDLGQGNDHFFGGKHAETVKDGAGFDTIKLGAGNDTFKSTVSVGDGIDKIDGSTGVDTYDASLRTDDLTINLDTNPHDEPIGQNFSERSAAALTAKSETPANAAETITHFENVVGGSGADVIFGTNGANILDGGSNGADDLFGLGGNDTLLGGTNDDFLVGGVGKDDLTGGIGGDRFWYFSLSESTVASSGRDIIEDFTQGADIIDLSQIDADTTNAPATNDVFNFIDNAAFSGNGAAGELHFVSTTTGWTVEGDVNGNGTADFASISLIPLTPLIWPARISTCKKPSCLAG